MFNCWHLPFPPTNIQFNDSCSMMFRNDGCKSSLILIASYLLSRDKNGDKELSGIWESQFTIIAESCLSNIWTNIPIHFHLPVDVCVEPHKSKTGNKLLEKDGLQKTLKPFLTYCYHPGAVYES